MSNPFLPVHPELLIETAPTIPIIAGINNMEGLIGIDGKVNFLKYYYLLNKLSVLLTETK